MSKEWEVMRKEWRVTRKKWDTIHAYRVAYRAAWLMQELDLCFKDHAYYSDVDVPETVKAAYRTLDDWIRAQVKDTAAELDGMIKEMGE